MATRNDVGQRISGARDIALPGQQVAVPGVTAPRGGQAVRMDAQQEVLSGLADFGSSVIQSAAKQRYETLQMEGAMAYQQGKALDELPTDNNKWALEGYRVMEAETVSAALLAAQSEEISASLFEQDPAAFRSRYTARVNEALAGKDVRTQELIKSTMAQQMPALVEQHTREHARFLEKKTYDTFTAGVDIMSRNPDTAKSLLSFARGEGAGAGLAPSKRADAVIDGVVQAYANKNPTAYAVLQSAGMFDSLTAEQASRLDSAKRGYESRITSEYDPARLRAEQDILGRIERGEYEDPMQGVEDYSKFWAEYGVDISASAAEGVYGAGRSAASEHSRAVQLEIQTAKLNGDFGRVAELSVQHANNAGTAGPRPTYKHNTAIEFSMGPARPNRPDQPVLDVAGKAAEDVFGPGAKIIVTSGKEDAGNQHGSNRHKTGDAADLAVIRPDGTRVKSTDPDMKAFAKAAAAAGATGIGFGEEYMGGEHIHVDLVTPGAGQGNVWSSGAKGMGAELTGAMRGYSSGPNVGAVDPQKWASAVDYAKGDLELAAVVYADGQDAAQAWVDGGRTADTLSDTARNFQTGLMGNVKGVQYETAATRAARAETMLKDTAERVGVEAYANVARRDFAIDQDFIAGKMTVPEYINERQANRAEWGLAQTKADINHELSTFQKRQDEAMRIAKETGNVAAQENLVGFGLEKLDLDSAMETALQAITTMPKPEGMSDNEFMQLQQDSIAVARDQYIRDLGAAADTRGIPVEKRGVVDAVSTTQTKVKSAMEAARKNTMQAALVERHTQQGTLNTADKDVQARAFKESRTWLKEQTNTFAKTPNADGTAKTPDQVAAFQQEAEEDWYVRTNFVPESVRTQMSGPLRGPLVLPDGSVSPHAMAAITAYGDLRAKSYTAADQLLEPDARVLADAVLDATAGNQAAMPRVMAALWADGFGNRFSGKPDPAYAERQDVQEAIRSSIGAGAMRTLFGSIFGETAIQSMNLDSASQESMSSALMGQVQKLSALAPGLNPKALVKQAERGVLRSTAPVRSDPIGMSMFGVTKDNTFVQDMSGADIWASMFGRDADTYSADRDSFSTAIDTYLSSDDFATRYGIAPPTVSAWTMLKSGLPFSGISDSQAARMLGKPNYSVQGVHQGKMYIDIAMDDAGTIQSMILPLEEIGTWYKSMDKERVTK